MLNILKRLERLCFLAQKAKIWKVVVSFAKKNVRFEMITLKIGCMPNFVEIRKLIVSGTKCPKVGIWAHNLGKQISDLKSAPSK